METQTTALATTEPSIQTNSAALVLSPERMQAMFKFAEMMASGIATVPKHLQRNPADCLAVTMQATQWGMNPFAVAQKTHVVSGTLGYEAQLVNAVVQSSGAIDGRFHYEYKGQGDLLECRVGAVPKGEKEIAWGMWLAAKAVTTKNSPLWKVNPAQQLGYLQVKNWARLYAPGAILGVYSADELGDISVNPNAPEKPEAPTIPAELLKASQEAAALGVAAYRKFWTELQTEQRQALASVHNDNKATAEQADKARTVETPPPAQPAAPESGAPLVGYDSIMQSLLTAEDEERLQEVADLIGAIQVAEQRAQLSAVYQDRMTEFVSAP